MQEMLPGIINQIIFRGLRMLAALRSLHRPLAAAAPRPLAPVALPVVRWRSTNPHFRMRWRASLDPAQDRSEKANRVHVKDGKWVPTHRPRPRGGKYPNTQRTPKLKSYRPVCVINDLNFFRVMHNACHLPTV
jgi:hypothetical protein